MVKFIKRHRVFLAFFALSIIVFLWDLISLKKTFLYGDYQLQFFPWYAEYSRALKQFTLPFWASNMGCGFPLVAEGQIGAFYPLNLIFFFFLPFLVAYNYSIILHFALGGIFMYIFSRALKLSNPAAALTSILFMFSSPYAGCFSNIASLKVLCWFPLVLYFIFIAVEREKVSRLLLAGVIIGFQLLAGAVQMAAYSIGFTFLFFLIVLFSAKKELKSNVKCVFFWGAGIIISFLIFLPQAIPTLKLIGFSLRASGGQEFASWSSFFPAGMVTLFFPHLTVIFRSMVYIGILPFFLSLVALFNLKNKYIAIFMSLFLFSLILSFGSYTFVYPLVLKLTQLYFFRTPSKILFFSSFFLIILAGFGFDLLLNRDAKFMTARFSKLVGSLAVIPCVSVLLSYLLLSLNKGLFLRLGQLYVEKYIYNRPFHRYSLEQYLDRLNALYNNFLSALSPVNPLVYIPALFVILSAVLIISFLNQSIRRKVFIFLAPILIGADLIFFSLTGTGFKGNIIPFNTILNDQSVVSIFKRDSSRFRIYIFDQPKIGPTLALQANCNMYFDINNIGIYTPLVFSSYRLLLEDLGCVDDSLGLIPPTDEALKRNLNLLSSINVKYIISQNALKYPNLKLIKEVGKEKIYLNSSVLPRAFIVHKIRVITKYEHIRSFIKSSNFNPRQEVVLEETPEGGVVDNGEAREASVDIIRYSNQKVLLKATSSFSGMLVFSDYYYPGWSAYLDGKPVKIYRANFVMRAIVLPAGEHRILFVFEKPF